MKIRSNFLLIAIGVVLSIASCKKVEPAETITVPRDEQERLIIERYLRENGVQSFQKTESGIYYEYIKTVGGDKPATSDSVSVDYIGQVMYGITFDNSYNRGSALDFRLDKGFAVTGFEESVKLLAKGEKGRFYIPSASAQGLNPTLIPAQSILIFDIELQNIIK